MTPLPPFYIALLRIHAVISRGIQVTTEKSQDFAGTGFHDQQTQTGFYRYVYSLLEMLHAHHLTEDELAFPYFKARLPDLRLEGLTEQHKQLVPHATEMGTILDDIKKPTVSGEQIARLANASANLNVLWQMHIRAEESYFGSDSVIGRFVSEKDQLEITRQTGEYSQKHASPGEWVVPFILYNLPPDERAQMAKLMPPPVVQLMVPMLWKNEWAPMKPFLLE
jgi:hemerythrin-like domain-containing protein